MASRPNKPITVALVDDYDVVVMGVANMFDKYRDRIVVAELDANSRSTTRRHRSVRLIRATRVGPRRDAAV